MFPGWSSRRVFCVWCGGQKEWANKTNEQLLNDYEDLSTEFKQLIDTKNKVTESILFEDTEPNFDMGANYVTQRVFGFKNDTVAAVITDHWRRYVHSPHIFMVSPSRMRLVAGTDRPRATIGV